MTRHIIIFTLILSFLSFNISRSADGPFILKRSELEIKRRNIGNSKIVLDLITQADSVMKIKIKSITDKKIIPPSGDKRDFVSMGQYWWPNPNTKNGLPYIRRDGKTNPESYKLVKDRSYLYEMCRNAEILGLAYFYTGNEKYAIRLKNIVEAWFLNSKTRMNPNLNYGQYIPGRVDGRIQSVVDTRDFVYLLDAIALINNSPNWTSSNQKGLQQWFSEFLEWLLYSKMSKNEVKSLNNNIGTAYDMQVIYYSLFVGKKSLAKDFIKNSVYRRINEQFDLAGRQILEEVRNNDFGYSVANLRYWFNIASLAENVNIDLWNYQSTQKKSIKAAYQYLITNNKNFKNKSDPSLIQSMNAMTRRAANRFKNYKLSNGGLSSLSLMDIELLKN